MRLLEKQLEVVRSPVEGATFLRGPAGCGKTTTGVERLRHLLESGIEGASILVLAPQRSLLEPYGRLAALPDMPAGTPITLTTIGGLARRMCELFWPVAARKADFAHPEGEARFLTLETAQYYMSYIVRPLLDQGYFQSITMDRNRLYAQLLDSLGKAAAAGFPHTAIGERLVAAWVGEQAQRRVYSDAQDCVSRFRELCRQNNLLDFSLQMEVFCEFLWPEPLVRDFLLSSYKHIIYDNVEEDIPAAHDVVAEWLPRFASALLIYDEDGGYRQFLGADPKSGERLKDKCTRVGGLDESFVMPTKMRQFGEALHRAMDQSRREQREEPSVAAQTSLSPAVRAISARFFPELLDRISDDIAGRMTRDGVPPDQIVIVSAYLSDALRFAVCNRLESRGVPWRTLRPSRSLRDEPVTRSILTIAALSHPQWNIKPGIFDVAHALMLALDADLIRSQMLTEVVYRSRDLSLSGFGQILPDRQERITTALGSRYSELRDWILAYQELGAIPLDHFVRRLFGEVLSQPGFGLHRNRDGARVAANLVESFRKFRLALEGPPAGTSTETLDLGREYVDVLDRGVIAAQYLQMDASYKAGAVLVTPAYSFLIGNEPVRCQYWLDPASEGWFKRPDQPLTHIRVLGREWTPGRKWTMADEEKANFDAMVRLALGLVRRCRGEIILCNSRIDEAGFEQRGPLLALLQDVLDEQH